jgi:hypothetical protein
MAKTKSQGNGAIEQIRRILISLAKVGVAHICPSSPPLTRTPETVLNSLK